MTTKNIQRVELEKYYNASIYCPFCGQKVVDMEAEQTTEKTCRPCPHTLFIATDEGFEFRSQRFDQDVGLVDVPDDEIDLSDSSVDGLTDSVTIEDAVKIASYVAAPSFFGAYVGFAPGGD